MINQFLAIMAILAVFLVGSNVQAQESFYKGKTIRFVVATTAGGGFDAYTRTLARYLGKYILGNPSIVVENMPEQATFIGANHMYKFAKPDGLTIGHFQGGLFLHQLLGRPGIEFDARKFDFIGAPVTDNRACCFTRTSGITSVEKWQESRGPVKLGGIGGGAPDDIARMLAVTMSLPIQLVAGYKGTSEIRLAAESGELAGGCWTWDSIRATWSKAIDSGTAVVVLQILRSPTWSFAMCHWQSISPNRKKRVNSSKWAFKNHLNIIAPTFSRRERQKNACRFCARLFKTTERQRSSSGCKEGTPRHRTGSRRGNGKNGGRPLQTQSEHDR